MCLAIYGFYAIDPLARRVILVEKLLKIWCYCLVLLSFNLWMRVNHRIKNVDPDSHAALRENVKLTSFFLAMFALMELPLLLSTL
ncbi:hypothetical protein ES702_02155 [subsurface metagenome]